MLAPIFVFISVVYFTSRLTENTEIICMLNGGVSFYRLLFPYMFTATLLAMLFAYYNHILLPKNNKVKIAFEEKYASKKTPEPTISTIIIKLEKIPLFIRNLLMVYRTTVSNSPWKK
jgi:lipopolysaccharide export LptBFGC system permease protein LptF